jgi:class 3 adenylate cyclase
MLLGVRRSLPWFVAYLALLVGAGILEPIVQELDVSIPAPIVIAFFVLNIGGVSTTAYLLLRYFVISRERERAKSERLLLNVLPGPIAARLRETTGTTIADAFEEVSVLFADIVGFTAFSANASPTDVVHILNEMFSRFDELADRHGLEKIKTIGDAYMVAGGIPAPRPDHAEAVAEMALDMMQEMRVRDPGNSSQLQVRIGIATGPVVAGVIGTRKFIYDLWGDTVNIAARITSEGVPGMIQCDATTYHRLVASFNFHEPQTIYLKGKGNMTVYRLIGRKGPAPR